MPTTAGSPRARARSAVVAVAVTCSVAKPTTRVRSSPAVCDGARSRATTLDGFSGGGGRSLTPCSARRTCSTTSTTSTARAWKTGSGEARSISANGAIVSATALSASPPFRIRPEAPSSSAGSSSIRAWASRMPASAAAPFASSRAALVANAALTPLMATCSRLIPASPVRSTPESWICDSTHRHAGAKTWPGAAAIPRKRVRDVLLAEVTVHQVGERRHRGLRLGSLGPYRDGGSLAHPEGQHTQDAFCISNGTVLDDFDPGVLEARGGLDEQRGRPGMQADLVRDGELPLHDCRHDSSSSRP